MASTVLQKWDIVNDDRTTYWLSHHDCETTRNAIVRFLDSVTVLPAVKQTLMNVATEMGVATAREVLWQSRVDNARIARNLNADVLPIWVSRQEMDTLHTVPNLPDPVKKIA